MALTTTTLSSAVAIADTTIVVASATGAAAGTFVKVDDETMQIAKSYTSGTTLPVQRGIESATAIHKASANATFFLASDEVGPSSQTLVQWPTVKARRTLSYSAAGAITLPNPGEDMVAVINGTGALAMTLAAPTKDMDTCILTIVGNGKAAHTVSLPAGVGLGAGGSGVDVGTFAAGAQQAIVLIASNGVWVPYGAFMGGTSLANVTVTWA